MQSGGLSVGAQLTSGATQYAQSTGVVSGTIAIYTGTVVAQSGTTISTILKVAGQEFVQAGGIASGTVISASGQETVFSGGLDIGAQVLSVGVLTVQAGGIASGATVSSGGLARAGVGGVFRGTTVSGQGSQAISSGATASNTVVLSGGLETVYAGGVESAATVMSGGKLVVNSGGTLAGGLTLSGGTATLVGPVAAGQVITFAGPAEDLVLSSYQSFSGSIAGLANPNQRVDLTGFAYSATTSVSWVEAPSNTSGTLTLTNGAASATLSLQGLYTSASFKLTNDGHGGTFVADPPVAVASKSTTAGGDPAAHAGLAHFIQAMAVFGGGSVLPDAGVFPTHQGGSLLSATPLMPTATTSMARVA